MKKKNFSDLKHVFLEIDNKEDMDYFFEQDSFMPISNPNYLGLRAIMKKGEVGAFISHASEFSFIVRIISKVKPTPYSKQLLETRSFFAKKFDSFFAIQDKKQKSLLGKMFGCEVHLKK